MWRIEESISGSYTGRIAPPGRPNMTSVPSISRLLMRAWAPVSFISVPSSSAASSGIPGHEKPPAFARGEGAQTRWGGCALGNDYEAGPAIHQANSVDDRERARKPVHDRRSAGAAAASPGVGDGSSSAVPHSQRGPRSKGRNDSALSAAIATGARSPTDR